MHRSSITLGLLTALTTAARAQEADEPFPASTAIAEGVSPEVLADLGGLVESFVEDDEIVGAELLVIKNGRSILHEAYGWRDREGQVPMETGGVFCVRSMTKPVVGAAILMLVADDRLELDDPIARYLPSFDVDGSRYITVEHLLTHRSGLPMSLILGRDLDDFEELGGIQAVAELGAGHELRFEPGSDFHYSDQGTDTLTALIEVVSGEPAADFVGRRVLEPLGMRSTTCVMAEGHALRPRVCSKYLGARGAWTRYWDPEQPELFPFFLGSQGLYSSLEDYARFMRFWARNGRVGTTRLLSYRYVRRALALSSRFGGTGFPGYGSGYGYLMQLWTGPPAEGEEVGEVVAFGHSGSDGTHAWVFPEQKAMVLYFTQSRNNPTGLRVEEKLAELFLGATFDPNVAAPPFDEYLGYYRKHEDDKYLAIIRDGEDLAMELGGRAVAPLTYLGDDRWKVRNEPASVLEFQRDESGGVTGFNIGERQELRFEPSSELPDVDEIEQWVAKAHRVDLLESIGPIRMRGELSVEQLDLEGEVTRLLAWPDRYRVDSVARGEWEAYSFDGERAWSGTSLTPVEQLEGLRADLVRQENLLARLGDWSRWFPQREVIQRLERKGKVIFLVRMGDTSGPAQTLFVEEGTGLVLRVEAMTHFADLGRIGQAVNYGDFRDVSGVQLPFETRIDLANPLIGRIVTRFEDVELGVELSQGFFELKDRDER